MVFGFVQILEELVDVGDLDADHLPESLEVSHFGLGPLWLSGGLAFLLPPLAVIDEGPKAGVWTLF